MFTFKAEQWIPKYLLNDKNGRALAMAIQAGLQAMNDAVAGGLACIADYDTMPEWRLDELAWETGCLYDYGADIATKRKWIKNATQLYALYGTPRGIVKYLEAAFDSASVDEWFDYSGDPYHFRVNTTGEWSEEAEAWARKSIEAVKNVRSVLDTITFNVGNVSVPLLTLMAPYSMDITDEAQMI